ncbi:MAG: integration host factor subunit alpha [Desulfobacteraceae bacterium]|jgi:integration host factor subunit alpha
MSITKQKLTESVFEQCGIRKREAVRTVESLMEMIKSALESGEDVLISGFGKFCVNEKASRRGRNPQTGGDLTLDARRIVTFKPSGVLKGKLNGGPDGEEGR